MPFQIGVDLGLVVEVKERLAARGASIALDSRYLHDLAMNGYRE
jgi:hypothetical protein